MDKSNTKQTQKYTCHGCFAEKYSGHTCKATEEARIKRAETRAKKKALKVLQVAKQERDKEKKHAIGTMTKDIVTDDFGIVVAAPNQELYVEEDNIEMPAKTGGVDIAAGKGDEDVTEFEEADSIEEIQEDNVTVEHEIADHPYDGDEKDTAEKIIEEMERLSIFDVPNKISFVAWNTRTLAAINNKNIPDEQWNEICAEFAKHDVITLTEILPHDAEQRLLVFFNRIKYYSKTGWKLITSMAAGPCNHKQRHAILVKYPIKVVMSKTVSMIGIDYSPLVVHLNDERMSNDKFCGDFVVSSIHMPPNRPGKPYDRYNQIFKWMNGYRSESVFRLNRCFTEKGAIEAKQTPTIHIMQGDWNEWIGNYKVETAGFDVVLSNNLSTSGGGKPYDNFIISKNYTKFLNIPTRKVLRFKRYYKSCKKEEGLSDHAPILFELEIPK